MTAPYPPPPPGPGPSNYYSPSPTMMYGPNGAGPSSHPYQYPGPHMSTGHPMPPTHLPSRGRGSYSQHAARGGPNHNSYQTQPFSPHSPHAVPMHPYPPSFAPPYPYAPQHAASVPYPPPPPQSWQQPQHLSPLPKQLSMPPPPVTDVPILPDAISTDADIPAQNGLKSSASQLPPNPTPPISRTNSPSPTSSDSQQTPFGSAEWVIWSKRPDNPSHAPGIIFSPHCKPPAHIVRDALQLPPPTSLPPAPPPTFVTEDRPTSPEVRPVSPEHVDKALPQSPSLKSIPEDVQLESSSSSTVPSSESTDTPTVPGSPISSHTSVSPSGSPKRELLATEAQPSSSSTSGAPPPPKKSWASLLKPTTANGLVKNALPKSAVVGFSIPAVAPAPVSPSKKNDLLGLLTHGSTASAPSPTKLKPRGLINTGNMCFANSVLQILLYCPPFFKLFHELGKLVGSGERIMNDAPLVTSTVEFLKEFYEVEKKESAPSTTNGRKGKERLVPDADEADYESFIPSYIYEAMKEKKRFDSMRGGHQEDAEEFLGFYLDTLEEELLHMINVLTPPEQVQPDTTVEEHEEEEAPADDGWLEVGKKNRTVITRTVKTTESPITKIFGGKARSTLRAPQQKDSVTIEDWRSLRLDIQPDHIHTIQDALKHISDPQNIQMTSSARPGITVDASQQVLIESLPAILILHVKRFHFDTTVGDVVKVGKQVRFGPELEIGNDIMAPTSRKPHPTRYKLFGAVYHHGISASGGHYTLDVLHPARFPSTSTSAREGWIRIDDDLVSDVKHEDVFDAWDRDDASSRTAYLLFYRRIRS